MLITFSLEVQMIGWKKSTSHSVAQATPGLIEIFTLSVFEVTNLKQIKMCKIVSVKIGCMQLYLSTS